MLKIIIQPDSSKDQIVLYCAKKTLIKVENGDGIYYGFNKRYFDKDGLLLEGSLILQKMAALEMVLRISLLFSTPQNDRICFFYIPIMLAFTLNVLTSFTVISVFMILLVVTFSLMRYFSFMR